MNVLSLFSGIGGLELGLERAGMTTVGQVEIDPYCRRVLAKHWPEVPKHDDVRTAVEWWLGGDTRPTVDLVCGGFPCQPVSSAGLKRAQADHRWLWPAFAGVIRALRPRHVLVENVTGLFARGGGMGDVLGDLATLGYDTEWDCIPAAFVGAPHIRARVFVVAHPGHSRQLHQPRIYRRIRRRLGNGGASTLPNDTHWAAEPDVARMVHGVPKGVDRRRVLGNAVVPQVAEHIGHLILDAERGAA